MKSLTPRAVSMPSLDTVKMEDRKRPAVDDVSRTSNKRQAVVVNGTTPHPDSDMPWKDDIEDFTKDAIQRRMREYKREAQTTREQLQDISKRSAHHDDHLRIIDGWFSQLLDEIALVCSKAAPSEQSSGSKSFQSSLLDASSEDFERHLASKSSQIKDAITTIFSHLQVAEPSVRELQERMSKLLLEEKKHVAELAKVNQEKEQLSDRLENASIRYMMAEKKMDRIRSQAVQKLEASAKAPPKVDADGDGTGKKEDTPMANGVSDQDFQGVESAKKQAVAAKEKIAEQLTKMEEENRKLTEKLTAAQNKQASLTDDDYSSTELYKTFRAQHEDVIKRVNDLQATHIQLRNEIKHFQEERASYKDEVDRETQEANVDVERQVGQLDADLARVRRARDELIAELNIKRASDEHEKDSIKQRQEFNAAQELRITSLESSIQQMIAEREAAATSEDLSSLDAEALRVKLKDVESLRAVLEKELASMGVAWQKANSAANKKWPVLLEAEERIGKANAEKAKADQKYFGAMKSKEIQSNELRSLKMQNAKTSDIVAQLKEAETGYRSQINQLEKQLAEAKEANVALTQTHRDLQQKSFEQKKRAEQLATQNVELEKLSRQKDSDSASAAQARHKAEQELKELRVVQDDTQKSLETWRQRSSGNTGTEFEMLKGIATCSVCRTDFKTTAIKTCGHVFCERCIQDRIVNRQRKCPNCNKAFGTGDTMRVVL